MTKKHKTLTKDSRQGTHFEGLHKIKIHSLEGDISVSLDGVMLSHITGINVEASPTMHKEVQITLLAEVDVDMGFNGSQVKTYEVESPK